MGIQFFVCGCLYSVYYPAGRKATKSDVFRHFGGTGKSCMRKRPPFPYRKDGRRGRETYLQGADEVEAEPFAQARRLPKQRFGEVCGGRKLSPHQPLRGSFPPEGSQRYRKPSPGRGRCPRRGRMRSKPSRLHRPAGLPKQRFGGDCGGRKLSPHQPLRGSFPPGGSHWQNSRCRPPPNAFPAQESSNMPWYNW